jgi:hypothetical protein
MRRKTNTVALLERARKMCEPPTWYQLAKRTSIAEGTISRCRVHGKTLGDINAWKLAQLIGMDAKDVMAYMAEDRAQDEKTKTFWEHQLPRLLPPIAIASAGTLLALWGSLIGGHEGIAITVAHATAKLAVLQSIHYAKYAELIGTAYLAWLLSSKPHTRNPPPASAAA